MSWDRPFDQPVPLPGERPARTLRDAGNYIRKLREAQRDPPEWRACLSDADRRCRGSRTNSIRKMGILRALNRNVERVLNPDRKDHHWGRRKLARLR